MSSLDVRNAMHISPDDDDRRRTRQHMATATDGEAAEAEDEGSELREFRIQAPFSPTGDQPEAIAAILKRLNYGPNVIHIGQTGFR